MSEKVDQNCQLRRTVKLDIDLSLHLRAVPVDLLEATRVWPDLELIIRVTGLGGVRGGKAGAGGSHSGIQKKAADVD
jgi:hypothetical protein